jgi:hypothetical protein
MEHDSLPFSQHLETGPYPEPDVFRPHSDYKFL